MVKKIARLLIKASLPFMEKCVGFKTDPTGYIPNRLKMVCGIYEPDLTRMINVILPADGVFIDIGANVGYISKYILAKHRFNGDVYAVEPNPLIFDILKENISFFQKVKLFNCAMGNDTGSATFYYGIDSAVGSLVKGYNESHHSSNPKWTSVTEISVQVRKGDELFSKINNIDLLKIDVEGFEMQAFFGMENLIQSKVIKNILLEFCPFSQIQAGRDSSELISFFIDRNYKIRGIEGNWSGIDINLNNAQQLVSSLGERGYTTLLASV